MIQFFKNLIHNKEFLYIVELIATAVTGIFGIIGVFADNFDKNIDENKNIEKRKLNYKGRLTIIGLIVGSLFTIFVKYWQQTIEISEEKTNKINAQTLEREHNQQYTTNIDSLRSLYKLQEINLESQKQALNYEETTLFPLNNLEQEIIFTYSMNYFLDKTSINSYKDLYHDDIYYRIYPNFFESRKEFIDTGNVFFDPKKGLFWREYLIMDSINKLRSSKFISDNKFDSITKTFFRCFRYFRFYFRGNTIIQNKDIAQVQYFSPSLSNDYNFHCYIYLDFYKEEVIFDIVNSDFNFKFLPGIDTINSLKKLKGKYLKILIDSDVNNQYYKPLKVNILKFDLHVKNSRHYLFFDPMDSSSDKSGNYYKLKFY